MNRVLRRLLCVVAAAGVMLTGTAGAALATPSPSSVEEQIDKQWNKLEPVIEQYNDVHNKLKANRAQVRAISKRLVPLELEVNMAMANVKGLAADAYKQGPPGALDAMILSGSPTGLTEKLTFLEQYARHQRAQIADVAKLRDRLATDKRNLDLLTESLAARDTELAKSRKTIEKKIKDLQKLRIRAYGESGAAPGKLRTGPCPVTYTNDKGGRAAKKACSLIGKPYVFGAEGPNSFDCSGLTKVAWGSVGVRLTHYTKVQWTEGRPVSRSELQPGDLVFYFGDLHHMAMYVGGNTVVHAPSSGDHVRMAPMERIGPIAGYRRPG
ncbi:C40 family peptidase [Jidongwangia harbinensis]|uniref:C40 family peptidase n=1 Tax=Jidongwangia harbinensis TaxID=2878561 RepID=UPI001CD9A3DE|nr:C40 family peptidase [Jidongwangia harbinensis]MCA2212005.1 NlpC/P60 family protein [Jidongwangia harbinensis]